MSLSEKIFRVDLVGAGGAGFPSNVRAKSKIEYMLANGVECKPIIHKDYQLMLNFPVLSNTLMVDSAILAVK